MPECKWRFQHSDEVGPVPRDGAIVDVVEEASDMDGGWVIAWRGRLWLAWWYELTPAFRVGAVWRTQQ